MGCGATGEGTSPTVNSTRSTLVPSNINRLTMTGNNSSTNTASDGSQPGVDTILLGSSTSSGTVSFTRRSRTRWSHPRPNTGALERLFSRQPENTQGPQDVSGSTSTSMRSCLRSTTKRQGSQQRTQGSSTSESYTDIAAVVPDLSNPAVTPRARMTPWTLCVRLGIRFWNPRSPEWLLPQRSPSPGWPCLVRDTHSQRPHR